MAARPDDAGSPEYDSDVLSRSEIPAATFRPDRFQGGYFELEISIDSTDPAVARAAFVALWSHPELFGPLPERSLEERPLHPEHTHLATIVYGAARLPGGHVAACASYGSDPAQRDCPFAAKGRIWRGLGVPMGSMPRAYGVGGYPFERGSVDWILPLSHWFRNLAERVNDVVPIAGAAIGHECNGELPRAVSGVGAERWFGYLVREGSGFHWFPQTNFGAHFTFGR